MSNDEWAERFRERLEVLRSRYGFSKAEMARRAGLPPRTLENYFKKQKPSVDAVLALAEGMNVEVHWLLGQESKRVPTDLVGEATWITLNRLFTDMIRASERGEVVVSSDTILGQTPGKLAAAMMAKVEKQYVVLLDAYGSPSIEAARQITEIET